MPSSIFKDFLIFAKDTHRGTILPLNGVLHILLKWLPRNQIRHFFPAFPYLQHCPNRIRSLHTGAVLDFSLFHFMTFSDLQLQEPIQRALKEIQYQHPTPIQEKSIPVALDGRDILGCARTGTGKTAAFSLPILNHLLTKSDRNVGRNPTALILAPTRELAIQIGQSISEYSVHTRIRSTVIFGGVSQNQQVDRLKKGIDILVATPGRLLDLMGQGFINLRHIQFFVLDEADRMLDMGFIHDIRRVVQKLPEERQNFFFSATMPGHIVNLAREILVQPVSVSVTPESSDERQIRQAVFHVDKSKKRALLVHLLKDKTEIPEALVFTRTKHGANRVVKELVKKGIPAEAIHGNKSQNARQNALKNFKSRQTRVLVATDIASRGIDIDELTHVINFDLPNISETYVHRIGRTGRAGASGIALSFCDVEEKAYLKDIQKLTGEKIPVVQDHPFTSADR